MRPFRCLPNPDRKVLYLTFDDGPDPFSTPAVLEVLARHRLRATFFVVARKARREPELMRRIREAGHAVGNHSLDHGYAPFFRGKNALSEWIAEAERELRALLGQPTVGFRPPAGIRTPELHAALSSLGLPLVLWNTRFFDTAFAWTESRGIHSLRRAQSGDIILLHDRQSPKKLPTFLKTLDRYAREAGQAGFAFEILPPLKKETL